MVLDPDELTPRKPKADILVGQDISTLSVEELGERIQAFEDEIRRTREALSQRASTKNAADAVFRR